MDGFVNYTTPALKIRLCPIAGAAQTWAVWAGRTPDDVIGFVSSEDELSWSARGTGDAFADVVPGFPSRKAASLFLFLTGGVRAGGSLAPVDVQQEGVLL